MNPRQVLSAAATAFLASSERSSPIIAVLTVDNTGSADGKGAQGYTAFHLFAS
jgi:hypothetical protein